MSLIRKFGNRFFSLLLTLSSGQLVADACSGMRVFRREAFESVFNDLPNDLSFALALTSYSTANKIPFSEVPISYATRAGESKLSKLKDGLNFLITIVKMQFVR